MSNLRLMNLKDLPLHVQEAIRGIRIVSTRNLKIVKGKDGKPRCTWCRQPITEKRRRSWCSASCVEDFESLLATPNMILERDEGKCRQCKLDLNELYAVWKELQNIQSTLFTYSRFQSVLSQKQASRTEENLKLIAESKLEYPALFHRNESLVDITYHIDHVVPVWEGGTSTADNMVLLCVSCHYKKTSKEATKRARRKREKIAERKRDSEGNQR